MMISDVIVRIQKRGKEGTEKERRKRGGGPSRVEGGGGSRAGVDMTLRSSVFLIDG